jgi:hypothetical protein
MDEEFCLFSSAQPLPGSGSHVALCGAPHQFGRRDTDAGGCHVQARCDQLGHLRGAHGLFTM